MVFGIVIVMVVFVIVVVVFVIVVVVFVIVTVVVVVLTGELAGDVDGRAVDLVPLGVDDLDVLDQPVECLAAAQVRSYQRELVVAVELLADLGRLLVHLGRDAFDLGVQLGLVERRSPRPPPVPADPDPPGFPGRLRS